MNSFSGTLEGKFLASSTAVAPQWLLSSSGSQLCPQQGAHLIFEDGKQRLFLVYSTSALEEWYLLISVILIFFRILFPLDKPIPHYSNPLLLNCLCSIKFLCEYSFFTWPRLIPYYSVLVPTFVSVLELPSLAWMKLFLQLIPQEGFGITVVPEFLLPKNVSV